MRQMRVALPGLILPTFPDRRCRIRWRLKADSAALQECELYAWEQETRNTNIQITDLLRSRDATKYRENEETGC